METVIRKNTINLPWQIDKGKWKKDIGKWKPNNEQQKKRGQLNTNNDSKLQKYDN